MGSTASAAVWTVQSQLRASLTSKGRLYGTTPGRAGAPNVLPVAVAELYSTDRAAEIIREDQRLNRNDGRGARKRLL